MSHAPEICQDIDNHCFWHHVDEVIPLTGAYQVCGECMHVFLTAADLVRDTNETIRRINRAYPNDPPIPLEIRAQNIYHCPHCAHYF